MNHSLLFKPQVLVLQNIWDTLSDISDKCLNFSNLSQATLGILLSSVVYIFRLKMLSLVLIKNCNSCVCSVINLIWTKKLILLYLQPTFFSVKYSKIKKEHALPSFSYKLQNYNFEDKLLKL